MRTVLQHSMMLFKPLGGWEHRDYSGSGGNECIRFSDRVYGVNGVPPQQFINFHHEIAPVSTHKPSDIFFFLILFYDELFST